MKNTSYLTLFLCFNILSYTSWSQPHKETVNIQVDLGQPIGAMKPIWAWFGYDEPNYTYMKDGQALLSDLAELSPVPVYVRAHNLLTTGDGTPALKWGSTNAYTEDEKGQPVYDWTIMDQILDAYVDRGMHPLIQIGFMPKDLSIKPEPYQHNWKPGVRYSEIHTGWSYPPKDYEKWAELCYMWAQHCLDRYGKNEVSSWYWQVWNEPDAGYWKGTQEEFFKLYDYAAQGVRKALPDAVFGGCNVTGGGMKFLDAFIRHCLYEKNFATGEVGSPLDIILFHAKGWPSLTDDGTIQMSVRSQLNNIHQNFGVIEKYPELAGKPVILGESDPEGCAACSMDTNPANAYRNGTMYSSYTAASFARKYEMALNRNLNLIGAVTWAFEFENQPWYAGFRDLATNGVNKPVLNVFRMYGKMGGQLVESTSSHMYPLDSILTKSIRKGPDVGVLASIDTLKKEAAIMVWNYHDNNGINQPMNCTIQVNDLPSSEITMTEYAVDQDHSNSYSLWKSMGSPQSPSKSQIAKLKKEGNQLEMVNAPRKVRVVSGELTIPLLATKQSVSLFVFSWK